MKSTCRGFVDHPQPHCLSFSILEASKLVYSKVFGTMGTRKNLHLAYNDMSSEIRSALFSNDICNCKENIEKEASSISLLTEVNKIGDAVNEAANVDKDLKDTLIVKHDHKGRVQ